MIRARARVAPAMDAFGDGVSDDELQLPRATLHKMINDALRAIDANQKISNECREMVCECGDEFVNAVSAEANEASTREGKSTITAEHVLRALRTLGFESYEAECEIARDEAKEEENEKREAKKKRKRIDMSAEDAMALQNKLFAEARAKMAGEAAGGQSAVGDLGERATLGSLA